MEFSKATTDMLATNGQALEDAEARKNQPVHHVECTKCGWFLTVLHVPRTCPACQSFSLKVDGGILCPGCSGIGVLTDDPQVFRCQRCGGIYTNPQEPITREQAGQFVALHLPMVLGGEAQFHTHGQFYFDLDVAVDGMKQARRLHGWADSHTKRVVQWG